MMSLSYSAVVGFLFAVIVEITAVVRPVVLYYANRNRTEAARKGKTILYYLDYDDG